MDSYVAHVRQHSNVGLKKGETEISNIIPSIHSSRNLSNHPGAAHVIAQLTFTKYDSDD